LTQDAAHITKNARGDHVSKIHTALYVLDKISVAADELRTQTYGPSTAEAVLAYKQRRRIINYSYQTQADNIVGKMTIDRMDREMVISESLQPIPCFPPNQPACT
jgi:hypothetical protein